MEKRAKLINFSLILLITFSFFLILIYNETSSAQGELENVKTYDSDIREITIKNPTLTDTIAKLRLITPLDNRVIRGKDRKVAEFTIENFQKDFPNPFENLEILDIKNSLSPFNKTFTYKYLANMGKIFVHNYSISCNPYTLTDYPSTNETNEPISISNCTRISNGLISTNNLTWIPLEKSKKTLFPKGNITIGIYTDVKAGENMEWILTSFGGVRITEWASWNETFNDGLLLYYNFNDTGTEFNITELVDGELNLTNILSPVSEQGIIERGVSNDHNNENFFNMTNTDIWDFVFNNFTVAFWFNRSDVPTDAGTAPTVFRKLGINGIGGGGEWVVDFERLSNGALRFTGFESSEFNTVLTYDDSLWHFAVVSRTGTGTGELRYYIDGINIRNGTSNINFTTTQSTVFLTNSLSPSINNDMFIDEFALWGRGMGESEVVSLYDGGAGTTFSDLSPPLVTINFPANITYFKSDFPLNFNVSLNENGSVLYSLDMGITNISMTSTDENSAFGLLFNDTNDSIADGGYTFSVYANDTEGNNNNTASIVFTINAVPPLVTINFPDNTTYGIGDLPLNFNVSLNENGSALYSLDNGVTNITMFSTDEGYSAFGLLFNNTNDSIANGGYTFSVYANDTVGNNNNTVSIVFNFLNVAPNVTIPGNITTIEGSQNFNFNVTAQDDNLGSCFYTVFNTSGGIDPSVTENSSCNFDLINTDTVSTFASYNLTVYANDTLGATNSITEEFTVVPSPGGGGGGGGGGGTSISKIPVIGIQQSEESGQTYTNLEREIIYAKINNFCSDKVQNIEFAVADFSEQCSLTRSNLESIIQIIGRDDVNVPIEDIIILFESYKNQLFFQGAETQSIINKFGLFSAVLGEIELFSLSPPRLDKFFTINVPDSSNHTIVFTFNSNKPVGECQIVSETPNLKCLASNSTLKVSYEIEDTDFISRIFSGTVSVTTDAPQDKKESRTVSLTFRVINIGKEVDIGTIKIPLYVILLAIVTIIIIVAVVFVAGKRRNPIKDFVRRQFPRRKK